MNLILQGPRQANDLKTNMCLQSQASFPCMEFITLNSKSIKMLKTAIFLKYLLEFVTLQKQQSLKTHLKKKVRFCSSLMIVRSGTEEVSINL